MLRKTQRSSLPPRLVQVLGFGAMSRDLLLDEGKHMKKGAHIYSTLLYNMIRTWHIVLVFDIFIID